MCIRDSNYVLHANDSGAWDELMPWVKGKW